MTLAADESGNRVPRLGAEPVETPDRVDAGARGPRATLVAVSDARVVALLREAVAEVLPETRLEVAGALQQARLLLATVHPDLILIDLNLIEGPLRDFIADAGQCNPRARIIVVAGHADDDRILPALRAGAAGFVLKYDAPAVVTESLRETFSGAPVLSGSLARQLIRHIDRTGLGSTLSGAELEVLTWVANGDTLAEAAGRMQIDRDTAQRRVARIYQTLCLGAGSGPPPAVNGSG